MGLAACGSDGGASASGTAAVSPNVGVIDRNNSSTGTNTAPPPSSGTVASSQGSQTGTANPPSSPTTGTATLDWVPPTQNSDGTALTNLAGYYVYYGTSPDNLTESVKVTNPGLSAFTVGNLTSGTWYFAVSAFSASGVESARTNVISTRI
jgi:hypothetical protein